MNIPVHPHTILSIRDYPIKSNELEVHSIKMVISIRDDPIK
jgi:hypothetical protein